MTRALQIGHVQHRLLDILDREPRSTYAALVEAVGYYEVAASVPAMERRRLIRATGDGYRVLKRGREALERARQAGRVPGVTGTGPRVYRPSLMLRDRTPTPASVGSPQAPSTHDDLSPSHGERGAGRPVVCPEGQAAGQAGRGGES